MRWFFILSIVVACTGQPVDLSCPVQMNPPIAAVRFGDSFLLNCSSPSDQIESLGLESVHGSSMNHSVHSVILEVKSVTNWEFAPICFLNQLRDPQCSRTLPITVYNAGQGVHLSAKSEGPLVEGQRYSIQCDIVNVAPVRNLSVHWHKGDALLYTERFDGSSPSPVNATSVFNLTAQRGDDQTRVWCEAQLDLWRAGTDPPATKSESHDVIVLYSPAFVEPKNETLELSAGSKFILDCAAKGNPTPVYSWHFPHRIQQTNRSENQSVLAPAIQLPGTYQCTTSNSQGSETKYFTVSEATGNRTTFAALVGGLVVLGFVIAIVGIFR